MVQNEWYWDVRAITKECARTMLERMEEVLRVHEDAAGWRAVLKNYELLMSFLTIQSCVRTKMLKAFPEARRLDADFQLVHDALKEVLDCMGEVCKLLRVAGSLKPAVAGKSIRSAFQNVRARIENVLDVDGQGWTEVLFLSKNTDDRELVKEFMKRICTEDKSLAIVAMILSFVPEKHRSQWMYKVLSVRKIFKLQTAGRLSYKAVYEQPLLIALDSNPRSNTTNKTVNAIEQVLLTE